MLVIRANISDAKDILKVIKNPNQLFWDWGPHHIDVAARWLPKKGFKILPKLFDANYKPGKFGDKGDELITKVHGCSLRSEDEGEPIPIWHEMILQLPEMKEELRKIVKNNILDMRKS